MMKETVMIDWQRIWNDDAIRRFSPTKAILMLFSLPYRLIVSLRNRFYDWRILKSVKLPRPVISIGNITVGGTGKTPCVIGLAKMLQQHGLRPAVLSRGYGGKSAKPVNIVSDGKSILLDVGVAGDEPLLLARSLPGVPVLTGAKRALTGQAAIDRFGAGVVICDDAFQHRQLFRDLDVVLLDGASPLGNGHLLPRGELREPAAGLGRAGCLIFTRMDEDHPLHHGVMRIAGAADIPVFHAVHRFRDALRQDNSDCEPVELRDKKICAFCGIARPESFRKMLLERGARILSFDQYPDHHPFSSYDLDALREKFIKLQADYLVTTEKDAARLAACPEFLKTICILRIEMEIKPSERSFEKFIIERTAGHAGRTSSAKSWGKIKS
jgi:tetraacyldisaccharide 4'-kinase